MTSTAPSPVNQRMRVAIMRTVILAMVPVILLSTPAWDRNSFGLEAFENIGILLLIGGVVGRLWSILYSGGRKNTEVVQTGPYSISRHPLYLFSTIAMLGLGMMLGSIVLTAILTGAVFIILTSTARREETYLRSKFGKAYSEYAARVPQILPNFSGYTTTEEVTVDVRAYHRTIADAMSFLLLIPIIELVEMSRSVQAIPHFAIW